MSEALVATIGVDPQSERSPSGKSANHRHRPSSNKNARLGELLAELFSLVGPALDTDSKNRVLTALRSRRRGRPIRRKRGLTISGLCRSYLQHADTYYPRRNGSHTCEADTIRHALKPLWRLFGRAQASEFRPLKLKEVRDEMVRLGWCRNNINSQIGRIKHMYKWAVQSELLGPEVYNAIETVEGLRAGRTAARESEPVKPAPEALIEAVLPLVSAQVAAMVKLQLVTGMRPGEVTVIRTADLDRTQNLWVYRPVHHKTAHHGHERVIFLGPKAQAIVTPFLKEDMPSAPIFSPRDAHREHLRRKHEARVTPLSCGNVPGSHKKKRPKRPPGDHYAVHAYTRAIARACEVAFPKPEGLNEDETRKWRKDHHWHPHQLRHNAATRLRKEFGIDVAQVILGHKSLDVTQVYAEKDVESAQRVMIKVG